MNDKIKSLIEAAGFNMDACYPGGWPNDHTIALHGLIESVILECATLTLDYKNENYYRGWIDYRDEINRHFGITKDFSDTGGLDCDWLGAQENPK